MNKETAKHIVESCKKNEGYFQSLLKELVQTETPPHDPASHKELIRILQRELRKLDYRCSYYPGRKSGGQLLARPAEKSQRAYQLLLGHLDTVWPRNTLESMPYKREPAIVSGPGTYDMKAGITMMLTALKILRGLSLRCNLQPVLFINSDEETGSRDSKNRIQLLARVMKRVYVLEPSLGSEGKIKTQRKGVARFTIRVKGRSSHAGLAPEEGRSAILALSYIIQQLFELNDPERSITVNVGTINGGIGTNVVAPESTANVDVRVLGHADAEKIEERIRSLTSPMEDITLEVEGGFGRPPMEQTPQNLRLWELAEQCAELVGIDLEQAVSGGASDGNLTSQFTATLDGLGAVGEGAHSKNEKIYMEQTLQRTALLCLLLLAE